MNASSKSQTDQLAAHQPFEALQEFVVSTAIQIYNDTLIVPGSDTEYASSGDDNSGRLSPVSPFNITFYVIYLIIFIVGAIGNLLVCFIVWRKKAMQTATNLSITNLALADLLLCVLCVPFTPLYRYMEQWVFGSFMCKAVAFFQGASVYISSFTLTLIAINRFFLIVHPIQTRLVAKHFYAAYIVIWCSAALLTAPYAVFVDIKDYPGEQGKWYCEESWPPHMRTVFSVTTALLQFVVPLAIISYCYWRISERLQQRMMAFVKKENATPSGTTKQKRTDEVNRRRKTNRMLISMVCIFGATWLPLNLANLVLDFYAPANQWKYATAAFLICHAWAMSSICYNPLLYAWLNDNFRNEFVAIFNAINGALQRLLCLNRTRKKRDTKRVEMDTLIVSKDSNGVTVMTKKSTNYVVDIGTENGIEADGPSEYVLE